MEELPQIKMNDTKVGEYLFTLDLRYIFKVVRSGDVMESFSPETPVLQTHFKIDQNDPSFKVGQITIDYFNSEFFGPFTETQVKRYTDSKKDN